MKFLLTLFTILSLISLVSATKLGITPGNLIFNGSINEKICENITLSTDYRGSIIGESKWIESVKEKRNVVDYNLVAGDLNLMIDFPEQINISKNIWNIPICITGKKSGKFNGAIIYKTTDSYAGVGSWIEVNIKNSGGSQYPAPITGFFGGVDENKGVKNTFSLISIVVSVMLLIMLSVLIIISRKMGEK